MEGSGEALAPEVGDAPARSQWQLFRRRFFRHKLALISLGALLALYLLAAFAPHIAPYPLNPRPLPLAQANHGPSLHHWFGTDELGRDQLTRIMYAGRISLLVGLLVAVFSTLIGVTVGALSGYFGGWVDQILMRITDLFLIVPGLAILAMAQKGLSNKALPLVGKLSSTALIIGIVTFLFWQTVARVVRGLFLSLREKEYVDAARASGASNRRIIIRHILPNIIGPIAVNTTLVVGYAIVLESTLSFLGFGIQPPQVSLGTMLNQSESAVGTPQAYLIYFPGLVLLITVLAVNFLGDGLRDAFDPQSKH
ncbi:MAG: ABC transporter permease [Actinobacteria bacterium]|nr:ABC transporter permease [Actinomycetota bacterium]MBV8957490.1 ABC transporter permease [Actinomycetota bacterium]MBV9662935.1 ABC transporter permease [Actinomycetota bacterium]MBV9932966.1 ABC transporter permease [Actinomycetota bacterium]